jgi:hypothetical protein
MDQLNEAHGPLVVRGPQSGNLCIGPMTIKTKFSTKLLAWIPQYQIS